MKTLRNLSLTALIMMTLTLISMNGLKAQAEAQANSYDFEQIEVPAGFTETTDWMGAWKEVMGPGYSANWIMEQMSMGSTVKLLEAKDKSGFMIMMDVEAEVFEEMIEESSYIQSDGGGTKLMPLSSLRESEPGVYMVVFNGTISGKKVVLEEAFAETPNGGIAILQIKTGVQPLGQKIDLARHLANQIPNLFHKNLALN